MFNTVAVRFIDQDSRNSKEYAYLTDLDLKQNDLVVVDTQYGYKTAIVTSVFAVESDATKWVVCKIDIEAFEEKLEDLKRKQFILKQMEQRYERTNKLALYAKLAESDESMRRLLAAFNGETKELEEGFEDDK